jgi:predicted DNA-binding protein
VPRFQPEKEEPVDRPGMTTTSLYLKVDLNNKLVAEAKRLGVTKSKLMQMIFEQYFEEPLEPEEA